MNNTSSASPCGCDPGIDYICQQHTEWPIGGQAPLDIAGAIWSGEDVAPMPSHYGPDGYREENMGTSWVRPALDVLEQVSQRPTAYASGGTFANIEPSRQQGEFATPSTVEMLRRDYPNGHPRFVPLTIKELALHSDKAHDYAAGGDPLGNFNRVSTILAMYPDLKLADPKVVALVYALKQLDAVLWGLNSNIKHKVEGLASRLQDISVYAKLVQCLVEDTK